MPWSQTSPMDQRTQFIADYLREVQSVTELCDLYEVSRKTGYKWIDRYLRQRGPQGWRSALEGRRLHRTGPTRRLSPRCLKRGDVIRAGAARSCWPWCTSATALGICRTAPRCATS